MISTPSPANLALLAGHRFLAIVFAFAFWAIVVFVLMLLAIHLSRNKSLSRPTLSVEERLLKLDQLRKGGSITDAEFAEQRRRILSEV
jgi:hypothetical protein